MSKYRQVDGKRELKDYLLIYSGHHSRKENPAYFGTMVNVQCEDQDASLSQLHFFDLEE